MRISMREIPNRWCSGSKVGPSGSQPIYGLCSKGIVRKKYFQLLSILAFTILLGRIMCSAVKNMIVGRTAAAARNAN